MHELLVRIALQVAEEMPIALGLALLGATEHGIELVDRLGRQQGAQEHDRVADRGQIRMEIAARIAEHLSDVFVLGQHRIGADAAGLVHQRDHERRDAFRTEHTADEIGAPLAIEHGLQQFDRAHRVAAPAFQPARHRLGDAHGAKPRVRIGRRERIVVKNGLADPRQVAPDGVAVARNRMCNAVSRLDVERNELDRGVDAAGLEETPRLRVVPGLVELLIEQVRDRLGVADVDRTPERAVVQRRAEMVLELGRHALRARVIELDTLDRVLARTAPVAHLETPLRALRDLAEACVIVRENRRGSGRRRWPLQKCRSWEQALGIYASIAPAPLLARTPCTHTSITTRCVSFSYEGVPVECPSITSRHPGSGMSYRIAVDRD